MHPSLILVVLQEFLGLQARVRSLLKDRVNASDDQSNGIVCSYCHQTCVAWPVSTY